MSQETAIIPGSFDPPHMSHIDLIVRTLRAEDAPRKVVVAIVHNPTKKERLISVDNAAALLRRMVPQELRARVVIANTGEPTTRLAQKFNATVLVRGQRAHPTFKQEVHELAVAAYFKGYQLMTGHAIHLRWTRGAEEENAVSSSRVRKGLYQDPPDRSALSACLPDVEVRLLMAAAERATAPISTPEGALSFNRALRRSLMSPKVEAVRDLPPQQNGWSVLQWRAPGPG